MRRWNQWKGIFVYLDPGREGDYAKYCEYCEVGVIHLFIV